MLMLDLTSTNHFQYSAEELAGQNLSVFSGPDTDSIRNQKRKFQENGGVACGTLWPIQRTEKCRAYLLPILGLPGDLLGCRVLFEASEAITLTDSLQESLYAEALISSQHDAND